MPLFDPLGPLDMGAAAINQRLQQLAEAKASASPSAGFIIGYGAADVPTGWLPCDGREVSRATYAALFAAIGETWGAGDGSSTFLIPDGRGRSLIGAGTGAGLTARTLGQVLGAETHQLTIPELPAHTHTHETFGAATYAPGGAGLNFGRGASNSNSGSTGGDAPHNNMQPSIVVHYLIKT